MSELKKEIAINKDKRKTLKNENLNLKYIIESVDKGNIDDELSIKEAIIRKLPIVLNEKYNHNILINGTEKLSSDVSLFSYNGNCEIEYNDIHSANVQRVVIHSLGDGSDSFQQAYNVAVKNLKKHISSNGAMMAFFKNF